MVVFQLNQSDSHGGAARAVYRIHQALRKQNVDSRLLVNFSRIEDPTVYGPKSRMGKAGKIAAAVADSMVAEFIGTKNTLLHSPSIFGSRSARKLNNSEADVVNLHWVNGGMLSISEIGNICKPVVWTLHDMWAFCGTEHYAEDARWQEGYSGRNRPDYEKGLDINRLIWNLKFRSWRNKLQLVTPSNWLADCVRTSKLMKDWPVTVIPNAIDTDKWKPVDKIVARRLLDLPLEPPLILFGAMGGGKDPRKGFSLLSSALQELKESLRDAQVMVFGQDASSSKTEFQFPTHYTGHIFDDVHLRLVYSAADVMVIPSRQDNLPNTGLESHACETPVVAFKTGGLTDIVDHGVTGYLAEPYKSTELAFGINWVLEDAGRHKNLCKAARNRAINNWASAVIARQYEDLYERVVT